MSIACGETNFLNSGKGVSETKPCQVRIITEIIYCVLYKYIYDYVKALGFHYLIIYVHFAIYTIHLANTIHMYSGITSGRVLNGELLYTKILEVNLFAFAYRLFHEDFSSIDGTYRRMQCPVD